MIRADQIPSCDPSRGADHKVLSPLERLAALAQIYYTPLASLLVSHDALVPVVAMLERATAAQISAFAQLLQQSLTGAEEHRSLPVCSTDDPQSDDERAGAQGQCDNPRAGYL